MTTLGILMIVYGGIRGVKIGRELNANRFADALVSTAETGAMIFLVVGILDALTKTVP